jgi:AraC-like DNA-binding protein
MPAWASGLAIHFALGVLRSKGWDTASLMKRAGLDPATVGDPEARLPHPTVRAFWREAVRETGDAAVGLHVAETVRPAVFDALGYVFRFSRTLGDALARLARYHRFVDDLLTLTVEETRDQARVRLEGIDGMTRQTAEFLLATLARAARVETGRPDLDPERVEFAFPRPPNIADHRRFFRAPLLFGRRRNALVLRRAALDLPLRKTEAELREVLERRVRDVIARLPPIDSLAARARFRMREDLDGGRPTAASVGRQLGLSTRSLHRRLREEGTTLGRLLRGVRLELAERCLSEGVSINETALHLGYSEASAFHRAFRRWTGSTPAAYRRQHAGGHGVGRVVVRAVQGSLATSDAVTRHEPRRRRP